jgi:UDP-N-acetylglucosamine 2-epimerase (non-hydrolysing)
MRIVSVVGARPNFMKIAPFMRAINQYNSFIPNKNATGEIMSPEFIEHILVHTGQHYDRRMSNAFFEDLDIRYADINLEIGSGTHAEQVGQTMIAFEKVLKTEKPDWVVVVGDVNATLACSITAKKEGIKCCHIEAGLRSGDLFMPEEINRLVTDRISDLLLAPDIFSIENLKAEGIPDSKIRFVGNIMIDTLEANRINASLMDINNIIDKNLHKVIPAPFKLHPTPDNYCILTIHRPSNVDEKVTLKSLTDFLLNEVTTQLPVIWPLHPRTESRLKEFSLFDKILNHSGIFILEPIGYLEMLRLNMGAKIILTDSGGLQEECTVLGTPFITLRRNTERPVTLVENGGIGVLAGNNISKIKDEFYSALNKPRNPIKPELWDGHTAERCLEAIIGYSDVR